MSKEYENWTNYRNGYEKNTRIKYDTKTMRMATNKYKTIF